MPSDLLVGPWQNARSVARTSGALRYLTGAPCVRGHVAPRLVSSGACYDCASSWRQCNKEKIAADYVLWRDANRESLNEYHRGWYADNLEQARAGSREASRKKRDKDPEGYARAALAFYHKKMEDPEFRELHSHRSKNNRAKRMKADGSFTQGDVIRIHADQHHKCAICGVDTTNGFHIDHITPLSRGGSNWPANLQILCRRCNSSKGSKTMDEFYEMLRRRASNDNKIAVPLKLAVD